MSINKLKKLIEKCEKENLEIIRTNFYNGGHEKAVAVVSERTKRNDVKYLCYEDGLWKVNKY